MAILLRAFSSRSNRYAGKRYNPRKERRAEMMETMRRLRRAAAVWGVWMMAAGIAGAASSPWEQPAGALADRIAAILGPAQAHLTLHNLSSIPAAEIPTIRRLLEDDLGARGVALAGEESANAIRVTLSESSRERVWVAEVAEGKVTQVAMIELDGTGARPPAAAGGLTLRRQAIFHTRDQVLAALEVENGLVVLEPEQVVLFLRTADGWRELKRADIGQKQPLPRDPRGLLTEEGAGSRFHAWLAGEQCEGPLPLASGAVNCHASDDPWPIPALTTTTATVSAFYNAARNYFTGVVTPSVGADLPRFYASSWIPRSAGGVALLIAGIDGKAQIVETGALKPLTGTRDWGSDFAVLNSGCGSGWQIITSGSGEAAGDSLRAFELPAFEAIPAGAPVELNGSVTALWPAPDLRSAVAILETRGGEYEVDRVTALCN